ncbi:hypothetical protein GQ53DRAFT_647871 [Thozetella sp. PMI_491]|nr:hypothetical protein GQ53DRAFT_647871 [Thozetella sp. PMI_491]
MAAEGLSNDGSRVTQLPPLQPSLVSATTPQRQGESRGGSNPTVPPINHVPSSSYAFAPLSFAESPASTDGTPTSTNDTPHAQHTPGDAARPGSAGGGVDPNNPDAKKPRACESCRQLKVKCEPEADNPDGPCRRCAKAGRACVVTQPTRKRQKKTDSRVAELEKKIDLLTASLHAHSGSGGRGSAGPTPARPALTTASPDAGAPMYAFSQNMRGERSASAAGAGNDLGGMGSRDWGSGAGPREGPPAPQGSTQGQGGLQGADLDSKVFPPPMVMAGQKRKFTEPPREQAGDDLRDPSVVFPPKPPAADYADVVDRGIISMGLAAELFARYTDRMCPHLPGVVFPPGTSVTEVRKNKPTLFLSIVTAASSEHPSIQRTLNKELMQVIAEKAILSGEKSLEVVQAIQLAVIWYWPPEHFEELKFYQLVHIAAVMAIDIGLGRKKQNQGGFRKHIPQTWRDHPFRKRPPPDPTTIEARRAWLTCYFLATNTAMALHRPNLIRWSSFMTECVDVLESSPEAAPTDRYLCHLVWTHRLAEEVAMQFSIDDPSSATNFSDKQTQYALRGFERNLEKYRNGLPPEDRQPSLQLGFHVVNLYMHEIATQADFLDQQPGGEGDSVELPLTPAHINAISACLTAIDGIFEVFLGMDVASIRCLPVFNFVRVAYAVVILIKMYFAASAEKSELGKVIDKDNMKVEQHVEQLLEKFRATAADDRSRPAAKFMVVLAMLRSWFQKQKQTGGPGMSSTPAPGSGKDTPTPFPSESPYQARKDGATPQLPTAYSSTANTPLQLLSEIAANDSAANKSDMAPGQAWLLRPQPAQPFMYDNAERAPATTAVTPDSTNASSLDSTSKMTPGFPQMYRGGTIPWVNGNWNADFDYTSLGTDFAQAMDLTLADLTDGGFSSSLENSMRIVMQEPPWFGAGFFDASGAGMGGSGFY